MLSLSSFISDVQQVVDATGLALGCDVEVIDPEMTRVAATSSLKSTLGQPLRHGHGYTYVVRYKEPIIVDNPGEHFSCKGCAIKEHCYYKIAVASPILLGDEALGVIAIAAFEEKTADHIKNNLKPLLAFLRKMAELLSAKISEQYLYHSLEVATVELTAILDKANKGLVAFGGRGNVLHYNKTILDLLGIAPDQSAQQLLEETFRQYVTGKRKASLHKIIRGRSLLMEVEPIPVVRDTINEMVWLVSCADYNMVKKSASALTLGGASIHFSDIITRNAGLMNRIAMAKRISRSCSTVLISGESGTGKELFARAIHFESGRTGPLIAINCGAIPEPLLESELFGYEAGAFTGARKEGKPGKFELAEGGTLFLDEIGTMPLHLQAKLLRVLEERRVERLGGKYSFPIDVRIIAASNEDLQQRVKQARFRSDLYFRINVIPIDIPPLRDRKEDIPLLADFYLRYYCGKLGKSIDKLEPSVLDKLARYDWPGNVRELSNAIEYAVNVGETVHLTVENLPSSLTTVTDPGPQNLDQIRKEQMITLLNQFGWGKNGKKRAAASLGVSLATIYRWVEKYHLSSH